MPELPEVETIARGLAPRVTDRSIVAVVHLDWERMVETPAPPDFSRLLAGRHIAGTARRAKWLLLPLDAGWTLALHLRMSGRVGVSDAPPLDDPHTHLVLALDNGTTLWLRDPRKFGRARLLDAAGMAQLDAAHGPEPLDPAFTNECLARLLRRHRQRLKPLLLNQRVIAGLGNIYVDESLWHARLHPQRAAESLSAGECARLHAAIRHVLQRAIEHEGSTLRDYRTSSGSSGSNQHFFAVYQRSGQPCPACGTPIERMVVAQRGTHFCPRCQPACSNTA